MDRAVKPLIDRLARIAYVVAYRLMRLWWFVRRPATRGSLVAIWHDNEVLVVRTSYRPVLSLPGGFVDTTESELDAAVRELREELGIVPDRDALRPAYRQTIRYESRRDEATIFRLDVDSRPTVNVDNREVVWAGFLPAAAVLEQPVLPHLQAYLRRAEWAPSESDGSVQ